MTTVGSARFYQVRNSVHFFIERRIMSDQKLHQDKERGARAEALLRNELLSDAFEALDADYLKA